MTITTTVARQQAGPAIPDYSQWLRDDLITETTRLALLASAAVERVDRHAELLYREKHHLAMASLIALTTPFDQAAAWRAQQTRRAHEQRAQEARVERLGLAGEGGA